MSDSALRTSPSPSGLRAFVARIEDRTPQGRDRALDALRALAILGVVAGHWLVTAVVTDSGSLRVTSPLRSLPQLAPVSWAFQMLAIFFLVGGLVGAKGYRSARAAGIGYGPWLLGRLGRLFRPVAVVSAVWAVAAVVMLASGVALEDVRALVRLVVAPMWFLLVFAGLTAATPLVARLHPAWPLAAVVAADLVRFGPGGPGWLWWVNVAAGWLVPYCLGAAWARGALRSRATGWTLLAGGGAGAVALVVWGGYPATMVGVPGAPVSNLDPPSLAAVAFGLAQCGAALLLLGPLRRLLRRPAAWAAVAVANLAAMTIFLWHQTAMIAVTELGLLASRALPGSLRGDALPGLHTAPDGLGWVAARLAWLPVFALALLVCCAAFHTYERRRAR
ncbi:acyltransferase [Nonomuraea spiralis]|uniref:Acyltransferase n=1 Tax=Nonomuraea spiralis TaxID=46182 RepID=A0ABV5IEZ3_9ACTN|nr:acyltransferase [Nonomuraea spiralis]GGS70667.1 acyltransferase [Nonomuraea spiralis]